MELVNQTPLAAIAFRQFRSDGGLDGIVFAKGVFEHRHGEALQWSAQQAPLILEDLYEGDPHASGLLWQSDITPWKPGTDVTFLGESFAPGKAALGSWIAAIEIGDRLCKSLRVSGPRRWTPRIREAWAGWSAREPRRIVERWDLGEPDAAVSVPLDWSRAFGGAQMRAAESHEEPEIHPDNPLGPGLLAVGEGIVSEPVTAHQLDLEGSLPLAWDEASTVPQGFAPIPPWWRPRQRHAGTYDEAWKAKRHPLLPEDFDPRFWQCASPDLVATPYLAGEETFALLNLDPDHERSAGCLPGIALAVGCEGAGPASDGLHSAALDGVHFDFRDGARRVTLTWRAKLPLEEAGLARLTLSRASNAERVAA